MASYSTSTYKVVLIGDSNVGKTSILYKFCENRYEVHKATIAGDYKEKIINLDGIPIKLVIWDTAGLERFRSLTASYYRNAMGVLLIYDVTNLESFTHLTNWLRDIKDHTSPYVSIVIVGNKCESAYRTIDYHNGKKMADNFDLPFLEVSCVSNINIKDAFITLARRIHGVIEKEGNPFYNASQAATTSPEMTAQNTNTRCLPC